MNDFNHFQPSIFSQISHELRIPLTGILGMTGFLHKTRLSTKQRTYVDMISEAAHQLESVEQKIKTILTSQQQESNNE